MITSCPTQYARIQHRLFTHPRQSPTNVFATSRRMGQAQQQHRRSIRLSASSRCAFASVTATTLASGTIAAALVVSTLLLPQPAYALPQERLEQIRQQIEEDFTVGQYYVTGKLTPSLYDKNCTFKDPTTNVKGVKPYTTAVASLFDPDVSRADLISSTISSPNSITLKWRLEGRLKLGNLNIKPYTGTTVYTLDDEQGLITQHTETWDISAVDAFVSTFLPNFGAPPAPPVAGQ